MQEEDLLDVPELHPVAQRILTLLESQEFDMREFADALKPDQDIADQLLTLASSPLYGASQRFSDLNHAVVYLGLRTALTVGLGLALFRGIRQKQANQDERWCWQRLLFNAAAARELAKKTMLYPTDQAFLAGLAQDFGLLLLVEQKPEYRRILAKFRREPRPLAVIETEEFGMDHSLVSGVLAVMWNLPDDSRYAIENHLVDNMREFGPLPRILRCSETITDFIQGQSEATFTELNRWLRLLFPLQYRDVPELLRNVLTHSRQLSDVLQIPLEQLSTTDSVVIDRYRYFTDTCEKP